VRFKLENYIAWVDFELYNEHRLLSLFLFFVFCLFEFSRVILDDFYQVMIKRWWLNTKLELVKLLPRLENILFLFSFVFFSFLINFFQTKRMLFALKFLTVVIYIDASLNSVIPIIFALKCEFRILHQRDYT
jgi:hypothetical protein